MDERPAVESVAAEVVGKRRSFGANLPIAIATIGWAFVLVYLATIPRTPRIPAVSSEMSSAIGHVATHAVLAALIYLLAAGRTSSKRRRANALRAALIGSLFLGTLLEFVQREYTTSRQFELGDIADNIVGSLSGGLLVFTLHSLGVTASRLQKVFMAGSLGLVALTTASLVAIDPRLPYVGDHWHARYSVTICGTEEPPMLGTPGGIHTHGDGLIHIHPLTSSEEGRNATLSLFFSNSRGLFSGTSLTTQTGRTVSDGDDCGGAVGRWRVLVNGVQVSSPERYVLRLGDDIEFIFGS